MAAVVDELDRPFVVQGAELEEPGPARELGGGGPPDFALECTGAIPFVRQAVDSVGMLGTNVLIGGAPADAEFSVDHLTTLWGKRIVGVLGGGGRSGPLIGSLMELWSQGRFPFDRLVGWYDLADVEKALADSYAGTVIKPVLRMPPATVSG